jgi:hypothetical protein
LSDWRSLIRGEVAEVTGNDTVILNIGMNHRVKRGMRFVVYAEAQHILDAHGNDLGALEIPKSEVEVRRSFLSQRVTSSRYRWNPF